MIQPYPVKIERLLQDIRPAHRRRKLRNSIDAYFQDTQRRDNRGRKASELARVITTLRHVLNMCGWALNEAYDLNTRRKIKKALRHIDHHQSLEKTIAEASKVRGLVNQAGRNRNERKEYGPNAMIALDQEYTVFRLNSVKKMRSAGRRARNCLDSSSYYINQLRSLEARFYELKKSGVTCACFSVDCTSSKLIQISGPNNDEAEVPPHILWAICKELSISGDNEELLLKNGILAIFLEGLASPTSPMFTTNDYQLWWREGEVVVNDAHRGHWSQFIWEQNAWCERLGSRFNDDSLELMCRLHPKINELVWKAAPKPRSQERDRWELPTL